MSGRRGKVAQTDAVLRQLDLLRVDLGISTAELARLVRTGRPRTAVVGFGAGWESGDPGCFVRARVVEDRGPVVAGPDVADLAVAQTVDVDAVPLDVPPAGGDAGNSALLCATSCR
jgi:hypothetical protein